MTVGELIEVLKQFDPKLTVFMAEDNTSTAYCDLLVKAELARYRPPTPTGYAMISTTDEDGVEAVGLWPRN